MRDVYLRYATRFCTEFCGIGHAGFVVGRSAFFISSYMDSRELFVMDLNLELSVCRLVYVFWSYCYRCELMVDKNIFV